MSLFTLCESLWIEGSGPTVVLLHGGPGMDARSVSPISRLLRDNFQVVRYNQRSSHHRAAGESELPIRALLQQIEELRHHLAAESLLLLGHSWGAGLAALYADSYPDNVSGLVLVHPMEISSPHVSVSLRELERRRPRQDRKRSWQIARQLRQLSPDDVRREALEQEQLRLDFRLTCADAPCGQLLESFDLGNYDWRGAEVIWRDLERNWPGTEHADYDLTPVFRSLRVPVQIVSGEQDVIDLLSTLKIVEITGGELVRLAESGHWSFLEQPEEFKDAVCRFLRECGAQATHAKRSAVGEAKPAKALTASHP